MSKQWLEGLKAIYVTKTDGELLVDIDLDCKSNEPVICMDGLCVGFSYGDRQFVIKHDKLYVYEINEDGEEVQTSVNSDVLKGFMEKEG